MIKKVNQFERGLKVWYTRPLHFDNLKKAISSSQYHMCSENWGWNQGYESGKQLIFWRQKRNQKSIASAFIFFKELKPNRTALW